MKRSFERKHPLPKRTLGRYRYVRLRWRLLFAVVDFMGTCVVRLAAAIRTWLRIDDQAIADVDPRRILIVQLDHLGDAVLSTGMLRALRCRFPVARIDVLASEANRALFEACPQVNRVHLSRVNRLSRGRRLGWIVSTIAWSWRLRADRYDLAVDPRGEFPSVLILWLCGARRRLGWQSGGGGFLLTDWPQFVPGRHEVHSRQALTQQLGIEPPPGEPAWPPAFQTSPQTRRWLDGQLAAWREHDRPLVVLHLGAGTSAKRWPAGYWQELLGRLIVECDARVVLVGGDDDLATAQQVLQGREWPGVLDWTGQLSLVQLAALVERADVLVGADSGPAHLAAAVGTPVVVLFSGTNQAEQWRPWGNAITVLRHEVACSPCHCETCPLADHPCMRGLLPKAVLAAIRTLLPDAHIDSSARRLDVGARLFVDPALMERIPA